MGLAKRIIPCLDVDRGRVVKGVKFVEIRDAGDPVEIARRYDEQGADEITFLDITASSDDRETMVHVVEQVAVIRLVHAEQFLHVFVTQPFDMLQHKGLSIQRGKTLKGALKLLRHLLLRQQPFRRMRLDHLRHNSLVIVQVHGLRVFGPQPILTLVGGNSIEPGRKLRIGAKHG